MAATDRNGKPCVVGRMVRFEYRGLYSRGMIVKVDDDNPGYLTVQLPAPPGVQNVEYQVTNDDVEVEG